MGWGRASSFGFSSVGFVCWQKPNVLDRALDFYTDAQLTYNRIAHIHATIKKLYEMLMISLLIAIGYITIMSITARMIPEIPPLPINHQVLITEAKLTDTGYLYRIDGVWHTDTVKRYVGDYFIIFDY